jgi:hypothetical protein
LLPLRLGPIDFRDESDWRHVPIRFSRSAMSIGHLFTNPQSTFQRPDTRPEPADGVWLFLRADLPLFSSGLPKAKSSIAPSVACRIPDGFPGSAAIISAATDSSGSFSTTVNAGRT